MSSFDLTKPNQANRNQKQNPAPPPKSRSKKWKWLILILLVGSLVTVIGALLAKTNQIFTSKGNILTRVGSLFISPDKPLYGQEEGLVNILLMGIGGSGHEGAHLTDTMIVASINTKTNEVVLTSIPRDFALILPTLGYNKINAAYAYAYKEDPATAADAAIAAVEKITGFDIPYFAVIDFKGFVKAINDVGGVTVTVDQSFTDASFPNDYPFDTKGYLEPVSFAKGRQHMDGVRALIFARSRHSGQNNEGSDFARSERQKKILVALKDKILALNLTNLSTLNNLLTDFTQNFRTNLEPYELKRLADLAKKIPSNDIYSFSLEPQGNLICSALVDPKTGQRVPDPVPDPLPVEVPPLAPTVPPKPADGPTQNPVVEPEIVRMYVIQPCFGKSLADVQEFLRDAATLAKLKKEGAVVEIQNSTANALATNAYKKLSEMGMDVKFTTFKGKVVYDQTIFYNNSQDQKPNTFDYLKNNYKFTASDVKYTGSTADFVIILGKDSL